MLYLEKPGIDDWLNVKTIWEDEETMKDVGGIHLLPKEKYLRWYKFMFEDKKDENAYFLIFNKKEKKCIGEISFHNYDKFEKRAMFNVKIINTERSKGYGKEAMDLALNYYFNIWNGNIMEDSIWKYNKNGLKNLKKYGVKEFKETEDEIWVELKKSEWKRV